MIINERNKDILKLARIEFFIIPIFIFFKLIRPSVLKSSSLEIFKIILLSLPNFFEAIIGTLTLTAVGLMINYRWCKKLQINPRLIYFLAVIVAATYVTLQELNVINTRANATMDENDLIFSAIGLIVGFSIVWRIKPRIIGDAKV